MGSQFIRSLRKRGKANRLATLEQTGALWRIGYHRSERAVYAGAYHEPSVVHEPEGTGAIYRIAPTAISYSG